MLDGLTKFLLSSVAFFEHISPTKFITNFEHLACWQKLLRKKGVWKIFEKFSGQKLI